MSTAQYMSGPVTKALREKVRELEVTVEQLTKALTTFAEEIRELSTYVGAHREMKELADRMTSFADRAIIHSAAMTDEEIIDLAYLLKCVETHADKFPVPVHMRALVVRIRHALKGGK